MMIAPTKFDVVLIDADRIIMGAGFGSQKSIKGEIIHVDPVAYALQKAKIMVQGLKEKLPANIYRLFIGDGETKHFRYEVAKTLPYKGTRVKTERPIHENAIREYLIKYQKAEVITGVEVDDALGIEQCRYPIGTSIICSNDKDLDMIPGWHYDMDWGIIRSMGEKEYVMKSYKKTNIYFITDPGFLSLREVGKKKKLVGGGQLWFCAQLLMGDKVDNIPGLPLNKKSAYKDVNTFKALKDVKTYEEGVKVCWKLYNKHLKDLLTEEEIEARFKEVVRLVWILRDPNGKIFNGDWIK